MEALEGAFSYIDIEEDVKEVSEQKHEIKMLELSLKARL